METKNIKDLNTNSQNPRQISDFDFDNLKKSIQTYGDLSSIVFNVTTQRLVGGHQRREAFIHAGSEQIHITQRFDPPTAKGTVALGYVILDGEQYSYREVEWPEAKEIAANIAANRITGEWDLEKLGAMDQWLVDNAPEWLEGTGQSQDEIQRLLGNSPTKDEPTDENEPQRLSVKLTKHQLETVDQAIQLVKHEQNIQNPVNDDADGNALAAICQQYLDGQVAAAPNQ